MIFHVTFREPLFIPGTSDCFADFRYQDGWLMELHEGNRLTLTNPRRGKAGSPLSFGVVGVPFTYRERTDVVEAEQAPPAPQAPAVDGEPSGATVEDVGRAGRGNRKGPRNRDVAGGRL